LCDRQKFRHRQRNTQKDEEDPCSKNQKIPRRFVPKELTAPVADVCLYGINWANDAANTS